MRFIYCSEINGRNSPEASGGLILSKVTDFAHGIAAHHGHMAVVELSSTLL